MQEIIHDISSIVVKMNPAILDFVTKNNQENSQINIHVCKMKKILKKEK